MAQSIVAHGAADSGAKIPLRVDVNGNSYVLPAEQAIKPVSIEHIPPSTPAAAAVTAASFVDPRGYHSGRIHVKIADVTPAGDLGGNVSLIYSSDGGKTTSQQFQIASVANIGADDDQDIIIEFGDLTSDANTAGFTKLIKNLPFKVVINLTGTLTSVTVEASIHLEKY
jgi:hypothetical protein